MKRNYSTRKEALDKAHKLVPGLVAAINCMKETPSGRFNLCVNGKIIKPPDFKHPNADSLAQAAQAERGNSEVPCVIARDFCYMSIA